MDDSLNYILSKTGDASLAVAAKLCLTFEGLAKIGDDGLVYPYLCPAGFPTQGIGLRVQSIGVPPITKEEALYRFVLTLPRYRDETASLCRPLIDFPEALGAITDFTFNLGASRLRASTLRRKINEENWPAARRELARWVYGGGRKLRGLVLRRAAEAEFLPDGRN